LQAQLGPDFVRGHWQIPVVESQVPPLATHPSGHFFKLQLVPSHPALQLQTPVAQFQIPLIQLEAPALQAQSAPSQPALQTQVPVSQLHFPLLEQFLLAAQDKQAQGGLSMLII